MSSGGKTGTTSVRVNTKERGNFPQFECLVLSFIVF